MSIREPDTRPCPGCDRLSCDATEDRYACPVREDAGGQWVAASRHDLISDRWRCPTCTLAAWQEAKAAREHRVLGRPSSTRRPADYRLRLDHLELWP